MYTFCLVNISESNETAYNIYTNMDYRHKNINFCIKMRTRKNHYLQGNDFIHLIQIHHETRFNFLLDSISKSSFGANSFSKMCTYSMIKKSHCLHQPQTAVSSWLPLVSVEFTLTNQIVQNSVII